MAKTNIEKIQSGLSKYLFLRKQLFEVDVSTDENFQKAFNGFFRMGHRTKAYYQDYYQYLQHHKDTGISFGEALTFLYKKYGRLEMSFASKMVAIVDPKYPIWDSVVTKGHFKIVAPYTYAKDRLQKGIEKYEQYCNNYCAYMQTTEAKARIAQFNTIFSTAEITDAKKLDFMLWQDR